MENLGSYFSIITGIVVLLRELLEQGLYMAAPT